MSEELYRENILDHYKKPHHRRKMRGASCSGHAINPFCGDDITFYLKVKDKKVADVSFDGHACAICTASASMLADETEGKSVEQARAIGKERVLALLGVAPGPTRLECALLPLKALKLAIYSHLGEKMGGREEKEISEVDEEAGGQSADEEVGK
jgi:nitrogen fixation NifU-like protein